MPFYAASRHRGWRAQAQRRLAGSVARKARALASRIYARIDAQRAGWSGTLPTRAATAPRIIARRSALAAGDIDAIDFVSRFTHRGDTMRDTIEAKPYFLATSRASRYLPGR